MSHHIRFVPCATGGALWLAATALLLEDAHRSGLWDVQHLAVPILTASTCVAGVLSHHALARLRLGSGLALAFLALLGSGLCVLNTLGRTAADRDRAQATATAGNRTFSLKRDALDDARRMHTLECGKRGPRCKEWEARVDGLTTELAGMTVLSVDPKADAIARLAVLVGLDGDHARAIVTAIEPAALPLFLELGAIILLGCGFPTPVTQQVAGKREEPVTLTAVTVFNRDQALSDFKRMRQAPSQQSLATRWGVSEACVSRWVSAWAASGAINRLRDGRCKPLALPAPR